MKRITRKMERWVQLHELLGSKGFKLTNDFKWIGNPVHDETVSIEVHRTDLVLEYKGRILKQYTYASQTLNMINELYNYLDHIGEEGSEKRRLYDKVRFRAMDQYGKFLT